MITGFAVTIGFKTLAPDLIYEMISAFIASFAGAIVVSLFTKPPANADADLSATEDQVVDLWR